MRKNKLYNQGTSMIEVVVGTALLFIATSGLLTAYSVFVRAGMNTLASVQASYLLEEGIEVMGTLRDAGWSTNIASLSNDTPYYLDWNSSLWTTTTTPSKIDSQFTRFVVLGAVKRDANDNISGSGTVDAGTKKVTVTVSWQSGATTTSRSLSTYMSDLFSN
ncbi:MAG: hypothetical protein NUV54_00635 [Candidatus Taylorbacteria bacterium]|nr:hypothetical protein [Candidatus Taylorbacteria bacterium]